MNDLITNHDLKPISTWWKRYRIMPDTWGGFQAEVWTIWWPFWRQIGFTNIHRTEEEAEAFVRRHANPRLL